MTGYNFRPASFVTCKALLQLCIKCAMTVEAFLQCQIDKCDGLVRIVTPVGMSLDFDSIYDPRTQVYITPIAVSGVLWNDAPPDSKKDRGLSY